MYDSRKCQPWSLEALKPWICATPNFPVDLNKFHTFSVIIFSDATPDEVRVEMIAEEETSIASSKKLVSLSFFALNRFYCHSRLCF